jgi:hypothetical protein
MEMSDRVPRVAELSQREFTEFFFSRSPVIFTGLMHHCQALRWTTRNLGRVLAGARLPVRMTDVELRAYCEAVDDLEFLARKDECRVTVKDLSFWIIELDKYFDAASREDDLAARLPAVLDVPMRRAILLRYLDIMGLGGSEWIPLADSLEALSGDLEFPEYLVGERDQRFWFTPRLRARGTIHIDGYHNLNAQISGCKRWFLQSPAQRAANVEAFTCSTSVGELLYIPKGWWHAASAEGCTINVNAWHAGR